MIIRIKDTAVFLQRVERAIQRALAEHTVEYGIFGGVEYSSAWTNADGPGSRSAFHKEPSFSYQKEWRLNLLRYGWRDEPFSFSIGDLRDICEVIPLKRFLVS